MARKAKNSQLTRHTHKGRKARTGQNRYSSTRGLGVSGSQLHVNAKLTSANMGSISPTPHGPEPHWPGG